MLAIINMKDGSSSCENHRGISLVSTASQMFVWIILRRLSTARGRCMHKNQACFPLVGITLITISTLRQMIEQKYTFHVSTISVSYYLKLSFDSIDCAILGWAEEIPFTVFEQPKPRLFVSHPGSSREVVSARTVQTKSSSKEMIVQVTVYPN